MRNGLAVRAMARAGLRPAPARCPTAAAGGMSARRPEPSGLLPGEVAADSEALATRLDISPGAVRVRTPGAVAPERRASPPGADGALPGGDMINSMQKRWASPSNISR